MNSTPLGRAYKNDGAQNDGARYAKRQMMEKKRIALIGSGGREHALATKLLDSPLLERLYSLPGNGGTDQQGLVENLAAENVAIGVDALDEIEAFCLEKEINLVVIGPEAPLVAGLADRLCAKHIPVFGPSANAARLEGSKIWMKQLLQRHNIPTAHFAIFDNPDKASAHIHENDAPFVIKADGLAAGKGVIMADDKTEALAAIDSMMREKAFGLAGEKILIEEKMEGKELSFFLLCDGQTALAFGSARDYKRAFDGDKGLNTGGMGAFSPVADCDPALEQRIMDEIATPLMQAMQAENSPYQGIMFLGIMLTKEGPKLIEINARFGDPECQALMMRLETDLLPLLESAATGTLHKLTAPIDWSPDTALLIVLVARGYPGAVEKNIPLPDFSNPAIQSQIEKSDIGFFHAGTIRRESRFFSNGGRVLNVGARGASVEEARQKALDVLEAIDWQEGFYRKDIGREDIEEDVG